MSPLIEPEDDDSTPPDLLVMHLIFDHPLDYSDQVVVVRNVIHPGRIERLPLVWPFQTVDHARCWLEMLGLFPIPRDDSDVLSLVETWI